MRQNLKTGMTTIIGSVPFGTPEQAISEIMNAELDIPAWPQLPKRGFKELMIPQYSEGMPLVKYDLENKSITIDSANEKRSDALLEFFEKFIAEDASLFPISKDFSEGFYAFINNFEGKKIPWAKGHITGPLTFTLGINDSNGNPIYFDPEIREAAVKLLVRKVEWQVEHLKKFADNILIFVDEPVLSAFGSSAYPGLMHDDVKTILNEIFDTIHNCGAVAGSHCCGNTEWSLFTDSEVDLLNFDAYEFAGAVALYAQDIKAYLERGGWLAWGVVPTSDVIQSETAESIYAKLQENIAIFVSKGIDEKLIKERVVITPSCGLGSLVEDDARRALSVLKEVGKMYKRDNA